jgi:hypothetical protein
MATSLTICQTAKSIYKFSDIPCNNIILERHINSISVKGDNCGIYLFTKATIVSKSSQFQLTQELTLNKRSGDPKTVLPWPNNSVDCDVCSLKRRGIEWLLETINKAVKCCRIDSKMPRNERDDVCIKKKSLWIWNARGLRCFTIRALSYFRW